MNNAVPKPITYTQDQVPAMARLLRKHLEHCNVMTFSGPLGAGKTTLVKALLKECGVDETITSPTFIYMNQYKNRLGQTFYHFDLYRINSADDFRVAGFDEYLYAPHSWALIEWPEIIKPLLVQNACHVQIDYGPQEGTRVLALTRT